MGYVSRLAEENRLSTTDLRAMILGAEIDVPGDLSAFGKPSPAFIQRWARYCAHCIAQTRTWRLSWELRFADACPSCGQWLLERCPACDARQTWSRCRVCACQDCGAPLLNVEQSAAPEALVRLSRGLEDLALGERPVDLPVLCGLTLLDVGRLVRLLGAYGSRHGHRVPQKILDSDQLAVSWTISTVAAEVLATWPDGFHEQLRRMYAQASGDKARSLRGVFGGLYVALYRGFKQSRFDFLRSAFEEFIAASWAGAMGRRNARVKAELLDRLAWVHPRAACQRFSVTPSELKGLIARGSVAAVTRTSASGRAFQMVRKADLQSARRDCADFVTLEVAARELGLKRQRLSRILLTICPDAHKDADRGVPWRVPRAWLHAWVERLRSYPPISRSDATGLTSLGDRLRYGGRNDEEIISILLGVQHGKIEVAGVADGERRPSALLFRAEALQWAKAASAQPETARWLNAQQLAAVLQVKEQVAYHWMRIGLLAVSAFRERGRIVRRVHAKDAEEFQRLYVLGRDLAREFHVSPRWLARELRKAGAGQVSGPGVDDGRQILYDRVAIGKLVSSNWQGVHDRALLRRSASG